MRVSAGAVASQVRADARRSWTSWLALGLLVGLACGAVMAASAAARRTDSAYRRFAEASNRPTAMVVLDCEPGIGGCPTTSEAADQLRAVPGVLEVAEVRLWAGPVLDGDGALLQSSDDPCDSSTSAVSVVGAVDGRLGDEVMGIRLVEGRLADPARADEAVLAPLVAEQRGVEVGDRLRVHVDPEVACEDPATWGEGQELTVVGIGFTALEIPAKSGAQYLQMLKTTPAFTATMPEDGAGLAVVLDDGVEPSDLKDLEGVPPLEVAIDIDEFAQPVEAGLATDANALWLFVLLAAVASLCVIGPAISRHRWDVAERDAQLASLGWARGERVVRSGAHAAFIWIVAAVVATAVMAVASTQSPIGDGRSIEPPAPIELDPQVVVVGLSALALLVVMALVVPATRTTRRRVVPRRTPVAGLAARAGLGPAAVTGVRFGLEPDRTRVPARTSILAVAVGVATVTGVLVYTASAQHLRETPAERGVVWDDFVYVADRRDGMALAETVRSWPEVDASGPALFFTLPIELGPQQHQARVMAFGGGSADIEPRVIHGRAPRGDGDLLLNPKLADQLGLDIGDTVDVSLSSGGRPPDEASAIDSAPARQFQIVGTGAVPIGDGAFPISSLMTVDGYASLLPAEVRMDAEGSADFLMIERSEGVPVDDLVRRLEAIGVAYEPEDPDVVQELLDDILTVDRTGTESVPDLLGWLMLLTGGGVLVYSLVMSLRQGREELAVLRTLGFDGPLSRSAGRWAGFSQAAAVLVVAVPAGLIAGRFTWHLYARSLGVAEVEHVPVAELAALAIALVLFSIAVASLAIRRLTRRWPASDLRVE